MQITTIDYIIGGCIAVGMLLGYFTGFVKQLSVIASLVIGLLLAQSRCAELASFLYPNLISSPLPATLVAFVLIWLAVSVICRILAGMLSGLAKSLALGGVNRLLGAVLGGGKIVIVIAAITVAIETFDQNQLVLSPDRKNLSLLYYPINGIGKTLLPRLIDIGKEIQQHHEREQHKPQPNTN